MASRKVYLDNNATTFMRKEVREALLLPSLDSNASSMYASARIAGEYIKDAREKLAALVSCKTDEIVWVSGATEANNTVLNIAKDIISRNKKGKILSSVIEHPSIKEVLKHYREIGVDVVEIPVDKNGIIDIKFAENELAKKDVVLTTVMFANNETGVIEPIKKICDLAHKYGSLFHTDATQAAGKINIDFNLLNADYLSLSAHKMYGPKGIGALIVKKDAPYIPFMLGGHQEGGRRSGTYNSNAIYAFGVACQKAKDELKKEAEKLKVLRDNLRVGLEKKVPDILVNSNPDITLPGTLNVSFRNVEGESILLMLDFEGIEVSTGSACATGSLEPSYVLLASGVKVEDAHGSIRFSFGAYNTQEDVDYVLNKLPPIIEKLRSISTRK